MQGELCTLAEGPVRQSRYFLGSEPESPANRVVYHVRNALVWLERAASGTLAPPGDPYELPDMRTPAHRATPRLVVAESAEDLAWWFAQPRLGSASIAKAEAAFAPRQQAAAKNKSAPASEVRVLAWHDASGALLRSIDWQDRALSPFHTLGPARWMRLDEAPVLPPWHAPSTWGDLEQALALQGRSLTELDAIRKTDRKTLFIGWPVPEVVGGAGVRFHWQALSLRHGLRHDAQLGWWVETENAHPEGLFGRALLSARLRSARIVLVGVGALGSRVADLLVRGGCLSLALVDGDTVESGNGARHVLSRRHHGAFKVNALRDELQTVSPLASLVAVPSDVSATASPGGTEVLAAADLVIDLTASDAVLSALEEVARPSACVVSASTSLIADRLFLFGAPAGAFRAEAFHAWHAADRVAEHARLAGVTLPRGQGCWSPLSPATGYGVLQQAGRAVKELDAWYEAPPSSPLRIAN